MLMFSLPLIVSLSLKRGVLLLCAQCFLKRPLITIECNGEVYCMSLDATKAFDLIHYCKLFVV